ncbi:MAG: tRNA lysidine(34) synthetase TilS [Duncaniella sp.]|nr:tRNA lysidine(34) synthetase TilS [Duncaniella sp.]
MTFVEKIASCARHYSLLPSGAEPVGVGLSGGADSVALLLTMIEIGVSVKAFHCNFHLRGAESNRDEQFCRHLCETLGVELSVKHFDVARRMAETGESVEMACRSLRYEWWRNEGPKPFAVAHHSDDNIETLLLNLMRGSGLRGLKGMLPRNGEIVRPLLCVDRQEIESFLASRGQEYVTDSTNALSDFRRNRLRNCLLPELERLFPGAMEGIKRSVEALRGNFALYDSTLNSLRHRVLTRDGNIDLQLIALEADPATALLELTGLNISQCRDILRPDGTTSGRRAGKWVTDRNMLCLTDLQQEERMVFLHSEPFSLRRISPTEFSTIEKRSDTIFLDGDIVDPTLPLTLRPWRSGDRLSPFGMKGSRLVSDIFNDAKIGSVRRGEFPLLIDSDGKVLWVCGLRASRHYAVTKATTSILMIKYLPNGIEN